MVCGPTRAANIPLKIITHRKQVAIAEKKKGGREEREKRGRGRERSMMASFKITDILKSLKTR